MSLVRSSYHCECKFCGAKHDWKSHWLPVDVLEAAANIWITFHALRHHQKEIMQKNRFIYAAKQTFWSTIIILLFGGLTVLQIIFYPLYWLLSFLYDN